MPTGARNDPYRGFRYRVEIDGIEQAGFSEATVPDSTVEATEYREGNEIPTVRKLSGLVKYGNLTLKWGITGSMELYDWYQLGVTGAVDRKNFSVIVNDEEGNDVARWNFVEAWPTKYDPADVNATSSDVAIETLEIVHEGMQRVEP